MTIQNMRKTYTLGGLDKEDVDPQPLVQFQKWFDEANQPDLPDWFEVNAMTLSTADADGRVSSRIVLLKGIDESGKLLFFSNYDSDKGRQMAANPQVSLCFFWPHLERQIRINGNVTKSERSKSEDYFRVRPRGSQIGAHVSGQSDVIENRAVLERGVKEIEAQFEDGDVVCPENWGGYEVEPERMEFWQGRPSRLHDRICYRRRESDWEIVRLAP
ncbi:MAG: pyridoxamine 5'-phosphate oxidase [Planctomycetota bacterium]